MPSLAGLLVIATPLAAAAVKVPPATLWPALFESACAPRPSKASVVPPASSIVPPLSASAAAAMLIPSASASPDATT